MKVRVRDNTKGHRMPNGTIYAAGEVFEMEGDEIHPHMRDRLEPAPPGVKVTPKEEPAAAAAPASTPAAASDEDDFMA